MSAPRSSAAQGERLYGLLLRLYPRDFRDRYAGDMLAFYRERVRAGTAPWLEGFPDLILSALAERFAWIPRGLPRAPSVVRTASPPRPRSLSPLRPDLPPPPPLPLPLHELHARLRELGRVVRRVGQAGEHAQRRAPLAQPGADQRRGVGRPLLQRGVGAVGDVRPGHHDPRQRDGRQQEE